MKQLKSIETDQYSLQVYECGCGFHIGIDASYLDQVGNVISTCPSCNNRLIITGDEEVNHG